MGEIGGRAIMVGQQEADGGNEAKHAECDGQPFPEPSVQAEGGQVEVLLLLLLSFFGKWAGHDRTYIDIYRRYYLSMSIFTDGRGSIC